MHTQILVTLSTRLITPAAPSITNIKVTAKISDPLIMVG